jgi:CRP/FNR family cyclic AMP-dependent transcriptional regulator
MSRLEHVGKWETALAGLTESQRVQISGAMRRKVFVPRQALFSQGDRNTNLFVVEKGSVRVFHVAANGSEFTIGIANEDSVLGAAAAVLNEPRCMCAESIGRVTAWSLARKDLFILITRIPELSINLNRLLASLAVESFVRSTRIVHSAPVKLGKVLRDLATRDRAAGKGTLHVIHGLTHQDFATMVGASRTWVTLTLAAFERQGLLTRKKGMVLIPSLPKFDRAIAALEQTMPHTSAIL